MKLKNSNVLTVNSCEQMPSAKGKILSILACEVFGRDETGTQMEHAKQGYQISIMSASRCTNEYGRLKTLVQENSPQEKSHDVIIKSSRANQNYHYTGDKEFLYDYIKDAALIITFDARNLFSELPKFTEFLRNKIKLIDLSIVHWLLDTRQTELTLKELSTNYLQSSNLPQSIPQSLPQSLQCLELFLILAHRLNNVTKSLDCLLEIELPTLLVLYEMEQTPWLIDKKQLEFQRLFPKSKRNAENILHHIKPNSNEVQAQYKQKTFTGRISTSNPNIQGTCKSSENSKVRDCYIARPENIILSVDYSQSEIRVLAHYTKDLTLLDSFRSGQDVYKKMAAIIENISIDNVTAEMRDMAKKITLGLLYGMGLETLALKLDLDKQGNDDPKWRKSEAGKIKNKFISAFPDIADFINVQRRTAETYSCINTLSGRKCHYSLEKSIKISSSGEKYQNNDYYRAISNIIQGSAADIIKIAMININNDDQLKSWNVRMQGHIHDELLFEIPLKHIEKAQVRIVELMENIEFHGKPLSLPFKVTCKRGPSWGEVV